MGKKSQTERAAMLRSMGELGPALVKAKPKPRPWLTRDRLAAAITILVAAAIIVAKAF